ncbi:MAG: flagellar brake domain-containing protein [Bacillota bacterium]
MSKPEDLYINQKISVVRNDSSGWYTSQIQDLDQDSIYITLPYSQALPLILQVEDQVQVSFAAEGASFRFLTRVTGLKNEQISLYRLARPLEIVRVQMRDYVRIPVCLDVEYGSCADQEEPVEFIKTCTRNLSAGGLKLVARTDLTPGAKLCLRFSLEVEQTRLEYNVRGQVVRVCSEEIGGQLIKTAGIKFINLRRVDQDKITRYVFIRMAKQKQLS